MIEEEPAGPTEVSWMGATRRAICNAHHQKQGDPREAIEVIVNLITEVVQPSLARKYNYYRKSLN